MSITKRCSAFGRDSLTRFASLVLGLSVLTASAFAQEQTPPRDELKNMSIEELMDIKVTSVSRRPEKLSETASAIHVLTGDAIRRSGATRLPEALRLAPNLQVAQANSHDWAITARGFNGAPLSNNSLANKLLVMIDGRSIYTHLFGGVFWDVQNVLLEDLARIEVVSGPGGTLWGANAVNGVINVVTKSASATQGLYATAAAGTFRQDFGAVRYGGRISPHLFYRVYGQRFDFRSTELTNGDDARDGWDMTQGGFRMDYEPSLATTVTVQGDVYGGREGDPRAVHIDGQNLLFRWTRRFSGASDFSVQAYADRTWRNAPRSSFGLHVKTYDLDSQHRFPIGERNSILWGLGYRLMQDKVNNSEPLSLLPARRETHLFSGFVQDAIRVVPDRLELTLGTKLEHNDYSGFEVQPSARLAWTPANRHTLWAAASRAVRSPSRFDTDVLIPNPNNGINLVGNPDFESEDVAAYELGYRVRPADDVSLSVNAFYNRYDDLRSINADFTRLRLIFANDHEAEAGGLELSGDVQAASWWHLRGGYTYLSTKISAADTLVLPGTEGVEAIDPHHQALLQSMMDLPGGFQIDAVARYVDVLSAAILSGRVPPYFTFDARLAWQSAGWEFSVVGQNLAQAHHPEFGPPGQIPQMPRSVYGKVTWRY